MRPARLRSPLLLLAGLCCLVSCVRPAAEAEVEAPAVETFERGEHALTATFDATLGTVKCGPATECDSGTLLNGTGGTTAYVVDGCTDLAHTSHTINSIRVTNSDNAPITAGDYITATVGYTCTDSRDHLEIYYSPRTASPIWTRVLPSTTATTTTAPILCSSTTSRNAYFYLPSTPGEYVLRAIVRHYNSTSTSFPLNSCGSSASLTSYADTDDLVFTVLPTGASFYNLALMNVARSAHTATLLPNGDVFVAGGGANSEVFQATATSPSYYAAGTLASPRSFHTANRLTNGRVLVAGGTDGTNTLKSMRLFNHKTNGFTATGDLVDARESHTATLLMDGRVLLVGGVQDFTTYLSSAELYDPATGTSTKTPTGIGAARNFHTASLLQDGRVLIAGGYNGADSLSSLVIYDPTTNDFAQPGTAVLATGRRAHTATVLQDGRVLIVGGRGAPGYLNTVEIFNPANNTITATGSLATARSLHTATLLPDGKVLVTGGLTNGGALASAELYTPSTGTWSGSIALGTPRYQHTAVLVPASSPQVVIMGGTDSLGYPLNVTETYYAYGTAATSYRPTLTGATSPVAPGQRIEITGSRFRGLSEAGGGGTQSSASDVPVAHILRSSVRTYLSTYDDTATSFSADLACNQPFGTYTLTVVSNGMASTTRSVVVSGLGEGEACVCNEACSGKPPNAACYDSVGACTEGECVYTPRPSTTTCNDGVSCTHTDRCDGNGTCAGTPYTCTPTQCQASSNCNGNGGCSISNKPNNTACDDEDPCTVTDVCTSGNCSGTPKVCNAPPLPECRSATTSRVYNTQGACTRDVGDCAYTYNDIDCGPGSCVSATGLCNTNACAGVSCTTPPNTQCYATTGTCANGACSYSQKATNSTCDDGNPCTTNDRCDAGGTCKGTQVAANTSCNDGDACTTGDKCDAAGVCAGAPLTCDSPADARCVTSSAGQCVNGACVYDTVANGTTCDDANLCTASSTCQNGLCTGHSPTVCTALSQCHTAGTCDPATGVCSNPTKANNTLCDDGNKCTTSDRCQSGTCVSGSPVVCTALDGCHDAGTCNPATGFCSTPEKADGSTCSDNSKCTSGDRCVSGVCTPTSSTTCPPPDQCKYAGFCDPITGSCNYANMPNNTPCDDGNACTIGDSCWAGSCVPGGAVQCQPIDQCHSAGVCNPSTGQCTTPVKADGALCDDGNLCTQADSCQSGVCQGSDPVVCAATDSCHEAGTCDPSTGICDSPPKANGATCDDGNKCTQTDSCQNGFCVGSDNVRCEPKDTCHERGICNPATGACTEPQRPNASTCDDSNLCTRVDVCEDGVCMGSDAIECPPPKLCQQGGCDRSSGECKYENLPDGTECVDGTCQGGTCVNPRDVRESGCGCNSGVAPMAWLMALVVLGLRRRRMGV